MHIRYSSKIYSSWKPIAQLKILLEKYHRQCIRKRQFIHIIFRSAVYVFVYNIITPPSSDYILAFTEALFKLKNKEFQSNDFIYTCFTLD